MAETIKFFDSNVLISASLSEHTHHKASAALFASLRSGGRACAAHSLAETYNTLTRVTTYPVPPADAARIIEDLSRTFKVVTLTARETVTAIEDAAMQGLAGPLIYDALLLACARKINARSIYTYNVRHFRRIAPDLASRIVEP
jgi:predicted nucleic acid-binding protein